MRLIFLMFTLLFSSGVLASSVGVPKLNLSFWNDDTSILWNNNCYNYSTNRVTNSFAQPGEASGEMYSDLSCEDVLLAAGKDLGLTHVPHFKFKDKNDDTLIALVVAPGYDFHWYRRDANNLWSHKPGSTPATTKDESDQLITDPETADRGYYTDFCGYFKVTNNLYHESEQDAGYVRIGDMLDLPALTDSNGDGVGVRQSLSEVEILIYSGRTNPKVPLEAFIASAVNSSILQKVAQRLEAATAGVVDTVIPSRLGYNGLLIHDRQGLMFPKGTSVHVKGSQMVAYSRGKQVAIHDEAIVDLESQLKSYFLVNKK